MAEERQMEKRNVATQRRNKSDDLEERTLEAVAAAMKATDAVGASVKRAQAESMAARAADEASDEDTLH